MASILATASPSRNVAAEETPTAAARARDVLKPVHEDWKGAKSSRQVNGNWLDFGEQTWTTRLKAFPAKETARNVDARAWRSPYCLLWRDGCERCQWTLEDNSIQCFAMADRETCKRTDIVCEDADTELINNRCQTWSDGCNSCGLMLQNGELSTPCSAVLCSPKAAYQHGFSCERSWADCKSGKKSKGPASDCDEAAFRLFRKLRLAATRARLQAYERSGPKP